MTLDRVERMCRAASADARTLRLELLEELARTVSFDAYAWLLTDPASEVGCDPVADVPCLPELPRLIRLKYLTPMNRWTALEGPVARLHEPSDSLVWRELLSAYDVSDVASVVFRDRYGCWAFLELWRTDGTRFGDADTAFLDAVAPPITEALRRAQARAFDGEPTTHERAGPAVLMLSPELQVRAQTPETERYLRVLVPPDRGRDPVPAGAYNVAAQLLASEAGVDAHPPWARVHLTGGTWLTLRAARLSGTEDIAVSIEVSSTSERVDVFTRSSGLSVREAELFGYLVDGSDTKTVAERMFLSEHTVQDHLKSIFAKTGTTNRRSLIARAVGT